MAVTQNNLIGRARGSAGNITFSTWKGLNVMKNKPATVAQPPSDARDAQQSIMRQLVAIGRNINSSIRVAFREAAVHMTTFNAFVKYNADEAFSVSGAVATFVAAQFTAAKGTLGPLVDFVNDTLSGRDLDVTWTDNTGTSGANASDQFYCTVISADGLNSATVIPGVTRSNEAATITIPGSWSLTGARACGFFVKADQSQSCDSVNIAV